jgi:hypothetical protein
MGFRIHYHLINELPRLGWLADVDRDKGVVSVFHGKSVECEADWMVEGVWDDDFEKGNFHRRDNFFGSGIRIEGEQAYFVPSTALVDRILYCIDRRKILLSNSLIILLGATGATLDDGHDYHSESLSILKGLDSYEKKFKVKHPHIEFFFQVFYERIVITKNDIFFEKTDPDYDIHSFEQYYELLTRILLRIKRNWESGGRKSPIKPFTTLSTGYDSTAVSCLAKNLGVETCFSGDSVSGTIDHRFFKRFITKNIEDARPIARKLGLRIEFLDNRPSSITEDELYFLSMNYPRYTAEHKMFRTWSELTFHSMTSYIENRASLAVVFTGYNGRLWDAHIEEKHLSDQIIRGDMSGLGLTEIRLKSGFYNVPVPFIMARNIEDIHKVSVSAEMNAWRLNSRYDRPIARRIAETAGVPRESFGVRKMFTTMNYLWPRNAFLRKTFFRYLREEHNMSRTFVYLYYVINQSAFLFQRLFKRFVSRSWTPNRYSFWKDVDFFYLMNHWSIRVLSEKTATFLRPSIEEMRMQSGRAGR